MFSFITTQKAKNVLVYTLLFFVIAFSLHQRISLFPISGDDENAYLLAVVDFIDGENPYAVTIKTYEKGADPADHGYAYLPGYLYIFTLMFVVSTFTGWDFSLLFKIPTLISDYAIAGILYYILSKKSKWFGLLGAAVWLINPYLLFNDSYTYLEPFPVLLMLISLILLGKDDIMSGVSYAMSIAVKTFSSILLPLHILKAKNKFLFLASSLLTGLIICLPFMSNLPEFIIFLRGSVFVHSERIVQGRPFLHYLSYLTNIEFIRIVPVSVYAYLSIFSSWIVTLVSYFYFKIRDKYVLTTLAFLSFYLFTPVFNRTHFMWFMPTLILAAYSLAEKHKKESVFYWIVIGVWGFFVWYLSKWDAGFQVKPPTF